MKDPDPQCLTSLGGSVSCSSPASFFPSYLIRELSSPTNPPKRMHSAASCKMRAVQRLIQTCNPLSPPTNVQFNIRSKARLWPKPNEVHWQRPAGHQNSLGSPPPTPPPTPLTHRSCSASHTLSFLYSPPSITQPALLSVCPSISQRFKHLQV